MSLKHPVKKVFITQEWGVNPTFYGQYGLKGHNGVDYRAFLPNGDRCYVGGKSEVFAPHGGKVLENYLDTGYGNYVKIENDKEGSILAHFSHKSPLKIGQAVKQGDFVGFQGTTGNSIGTHLHWGYYPKPRNKANGYSGTINQLPLISTTNNDMSLNDTIIGKSSQRDKVVNHYKFTIGTAKDDELLIKIQEIENKLKDEIVALKNKITNLEGTLAVTKMEKAKAEDELKTANFKRINAENELKDKTKEVEDLIEAITKERKEFDQAEKKHKEMVEELTDHIKKLESSQINESEIVAKFLDKVIEGLEGYGGEKTLEGVLNSISQREADRMKIKNELESLKGNPLVKLSLAIKTLLKDFLK
jgi:hypothetical protein